MSFELKCHYKWTNRFAFNQINPNNKIVINGSIKESIFVVKMLQMLTITLIGIYIFFKFNFSKKRIVQLIK